MQGLTTWTLCQGDILKQTGLFRNTRLKCKEQGVLKMGSYARLSGGEAAWWGRPGCREKHEQQHSGLWQQQWPPEIIWSVEPQPQHHKEQPSEPWTQRHLEKQMITEVSPLSKPEGVFNGATASTTPIEGKGTPWNIGSTCYEWRNRWVDNRVRIQSTT